MAESWVRSTDVPGWLFTLAPGVRFHDAKPVTAESMVPLLRAALRDPVELRIHPSFKEVQDVVALDTRKFLIRIQNGRLSLLEQLAELNLGEGSERSAAGAYRVGPVSDEGFTANAFDQYYRGKPHIEVVQFKTFRSPRAAWAAMMRDEIDAQYDVGREAVEFVERDSRVKIYPFLRPYLATLFFNVNAPQLKDARVRRTIRRAVDRKSIVNFAYRGRGRVSDGPLWPEHWTVKELPVTPRVGAAELADISLRSDPADRHRLRFRCLVVANLETQPFERMALMLQKQFFDAGIDMELELVAPREFLERLSTGRFEAALFEFLARTPSWVYGFWRSPLANSDVWVRHGYSGADRELDAMHLAENEEDLKRAVAGVYRKMTDDAPAIFIAWSEAARVVNTRFAIPLERGSDIMGANVWHWRPAPRP